MTQVTLNVPLYFRHPVNGVVPPSELRESYIDVTSVPKIAIAEDHNLMAGEHDIGTTGQTAVVQSVAKPATPELTAENKFAPSIHLAACPACSGGRSCRCRS
jgi:hypothetical protein